MGDRPRLAGAGAGQDADRAPNRLGRRPLLGIEPGQHRRGPVVGTDVFEGTSGGESGGDHAC